MAKIVITMFPEEGHLIPSFKLAHQLQASGHEVSYLGVADFEEYIRKQGFGFAPLAFAQFELGWRKRQIELLAKKKGPGRLREIAQAPFYAALCADVLNQQGVVMRYLRDTQPDLVVVDGFLAPIAIAAEHLGIRTVLLSININLPAADNYPPVVTNIVPDDTPPSRSKAGIAWRISNLTRKITGLVVRFNFEKALQQVMQRYAVAPERLDQAALYPRLAPNPAMPELIVCPQAFDFPRTDAERVGVNYIEASIDLARDAEPFVWEQLDPQRKLLFCTLGSQSHLYKFSQRFFQTLIAAVAERPEWQLVLAVGPHIDPASLGSIPSDMLIVRWVNQAEVLKRASLMINHGGLGTVKECLFFGVPVLAYPITRDQPGYAARIAYHKLGLMGSFRRISKAQFQQEISTILAEPSFKANAERFQTQFQQAETEAQGLHIIQTLLAAQPTSQPALESMVGSSNRDIESL